MKKHLPPLALLATYVIFRLGLDPFYWRNVTPYAAYAFEIVFVLLAWWLYSKRIKLGKIRPNQILPDAVVPLFLGFSVYKLAVYALLPIPFDLKSAEILILLLILAPVLEELIFRMALWEPLKDVVKKNSTVVIVTTVLFSIGHLQALWFVPETLRMFVLYQFLYVVLLGLAAGWRRLETGTVLTPMLIHFSFNLGFLLASRV